MDPRHLRELIEWENRYWWHVAKRALVLEVLKRRLPPPGKLVEAGAGAGGNLLAFREAGYAVAGFDISAAALEPCRALGLRDVQAHDMHEPWPVAAGSARAVVLLDVLEHSARPVRVLTNAAAALSPEGGIVLTVPAYPALLGPWDRMLGHHRRYAVRMLGHQAREAGLRVEWLSHWNAFSLPAAAVIRSVERLLRHPRTAELPRVSPFMNSLLLKLAGRERALIRRRPLPMGLSLVAVLTK